MAGRNSTPSDFYVYLHRRATDGSVFYVGKGKRNRAWSKSSRNAHWHNIVNKHGYFVEVVQNQMQEWWAFELEQNLIHLHGFDNLCNLTYGGEGVSGLLWTEESRRKMSKSVSGPKNFWFGKKQHPNTIAALLKALPHRRSGVKGKSMSDLQKSKISQSLIGHQVSKETRQKISATKRKPNHVICGNGVVFASPAFAVDWLKQNGFELAQVTHIRRCCQGKAKTAYGYTWKYQNENT